MWNVFFDSEKGFEVVRIISFQNDWKNMFEKWNNKSIKKIKYLKGLRK